jgi:DedD protein
MATEQVSEQEIQFRKRARRRLVGAVALVLLVVTVLPMILDDREDRTAQPEIAISIPNKDGEFASKVVPVEPLPAPAPQVDAQPVVPVEKAQPQPGKQLETVPDTAPTTAAVLPAEGVKQEGTSGAALAQEATAVTKSNVSEKPAAAAGNFSVQIGVFSDAANVKQLQDKLAAGGFKYYTEKLSTATGSKIRLRAGPFASRSDAEQARDALKAMGISGIVVGG